ncbi:hypothetical protein LEN26_018882 [Aphanomyces euteiches]|nr:hypothetical protein LEN26_018882 [Aphanomyces euteiches]
MSRDKLRTTGFLAEDIVPSSETLAWERAAQSVREEILDRVTLQTLYTRVCAPEYESDCNTQSVIDAPLKTIARHPLDLLVDPPTKDAEVKSPSFEGFLMVSSKGNKLKKMYCMLQNKTIFFLKTSPASKQDTLKTQESILLDNALQVRPLSGEISNWTIELVMIDDVCLVQAKDEAEYMKWVEVLCHCARYASVNFLYREILQLYEDDMAKLLSISLNVSKTNLIRYLYVHMTHVITASK